MGFVGTDLLGKTHESARDRPLLCPWPTNFSQGKHLRQHPVRTTRDIPQLCLAGEPAVTTRELGLKISLRAAALSLGRGGSHTPQLGTALDRPCPVHASLPELPYFSNGIQDTLSIIFISIWFLNTQADRQSPHTVTTQRYVSAQPCNRTSHSWTATRTGFSGHKGNDCQPLPTGRSPEGTVSPCDALCDTSIH